LNFMKLASFATFIIKGISALKVTEITEADYM